MPEIKIRFRGVCTHIFATHGHLKLPELSLTADNGSPVLHRVVLANSDLIKDHIDPTRRVPKHYPELSIRKDEVRPNLERRMREEKDFREEDGLYVIPLKDLAIGFDGVAEGNTNYWEQLKKIPHMWDMTRGHPELRQSIQFSWSKHAAAYIDFTSGARFHVLKGDPKENVNAEVLFNGAPKITFSVQNGGPKETYELKDDTTLIISNLTKPETDCSDSDYLLNYFVTTLDLCEEAPIWPKPKDGVYISGPEVYCSSSGYP